MKKMKILLVDDEKDYIETLSERMEMRDLKADIALSGEQALEKVEEDIPDVMVLDLKMPGIDGMEVLRQVRKKYPNIQVIMLTGHGSEKDEAEARRLGAAEYLQKPTGVDKLVKTIKKAFKKFDDSMVAATFAEAGDYSHAKEILDEDKEKGKE